jgi:hypothetical protein
MPLNVSEQISKINRRPRPIYLWLEPDLYIHWLAVQVKVRLELVGIA